MSRKRHWMIGLTLMALAAVGMIALAGSGFGSNRELRPTQQGGSAACTCDGDGDCTPVLDGTGNGVCQGYGQGLSENRPMDGTGYGARRCAGLAGGMMGRGACSGR